MTYAHEHNPAQSPLGILFVTQVGRCRIQAHRLSFPWRTQQQKACCFPAVMPAGSGKRFARSIPSLHIGKPWYRPTGMQALAVVSAPINDRIGEAAIPRPEEKWAVKESTKAARPD
ncbi:unnamed protein product [Protopolystoma xenopodis]|uniref:Uncharacterized protein n=1 Tax=Protopolystoma xenopodis TaxID=117903 RepID=A0A3S5FBV4_9PLAT|nr:unnamed protein product [Protopolystoma xenopodis]